MLQLIFSYTSDVRIGGSATGSGLSSKLILTDFLSEPNNFRPSLRQDVGLVPGYSSLCPDINTGGVSSCDGESLTRRVDIMFALMVSTIDLHLSLHAIAETMATKAMPTTSMPTPRTRKSRSFTREYRHRRTLPHMTNAIPMTKTKRRDDWSFVKRHCLHDEVSVRRQLSGFVSATPDIWISLLNQTPCTCHLGHTAHVICRWCSGSVRVSSEYLFSFNGHSSPTYDATGVVTSTDARRTVYALACCIGQVRVMSCNLTSVVFGIISRMPSFNGRQQRRARTSDHVAEMYAFFFQRCASFSSDVSMNWSICVLDQQISIDNYLITHTRQQTMYSKLEYLGI